MRRAFTFIELLVSLVISLVVAGGLFMVFLTTHDSRDFTVGMGNAETQARTPIDIMCDHLRNAQQFKAGGGTGVGDYTVISAGTATSVTYYASNSSTDVVTYAKSGTNLVRTDTTGTTTVMPNVQSLEFRYFKTPLVGGNPSGGYNNGSFVATTNANSPTNAELPFLTVIEVRATVQVDGFAREMISYVRLRNSPRKVRV